MLHLKLCSNISFIIFLVPMIFSIACNTAKDKIEEDNTFVELSKLPARSVTQLRFEPDTLHLSFTDTSGLLKGQYHAFNTGDTTFVIKKVKLSCGCTNLYWSKAAIAPGDSATFFVSVNTKEIKKGHSQKSLTLLGNMQGAYKELIIDLNYLK
jgi:hypothetical protein